MIHWKPLEYEDKVYDLSHLHPVQLRYSQKATAMKPERFYSVNVSYSLHCFTRNRSEDDVTDTRLLYSDSRETRVFDFERYKMSHHLPRIIGELMERRCYHTGKGNFFTIEILENDAIVEYEVYFQVSRSSQKGVLTLYIQSAYVRSPERMDARPRKKPIAFAVLLFNTLNHKPLHMPE